MHCRCSLPPAPWINLLPEPVHVYRLGKTDVAVRGKKQQLVIEFLGICPDTDDKTLKSETGASTATLAKLEQAGLILRTTTFGTGNMHSKPSAMDLPPLSATESEAHDVIHTDRRPGVLFDEVGTDRTLLYATLAADERRAGRATILLFPQAYDARKAYARLQPLLGKDTVLVHGQMSTAQRRKTFRQIRSLHAPVIVGTRTALFSPVTTLGLIVVDDEHEWVYKSEQTPRYHTRLTAEVVAKLHDAKLVLASATPSLESWRHTQSRYHMARIRPDIVAALPRITTIDLTQVEFGSLYPFSAPLVQALEARLQAKERSVLLLNRRGSATSLLCLDCRTAVTSPVTGLPLTVHDTGGKGMLVDHLTGYSQPIPEKCAKCKSVRMHPVGAGTQKIEALLQRMFPKAVVLRADADTLETPDTMEEMIHALNEDRADILVGTQPVLRAIDLPKVTLAAVMVADVGLSQPNFRAGERVFQQLTHVVTHMSGKPESEIIIQTFRPDAPEISCATRRDTETYITGELKLRTDAGYPPAAQMICLLLRGPSAQPRARDLFERAKAQAPQAGCTVTLGPPQPGRSPAWRITVRGTSPRLLLHTLPLEGVIIDVDPLELD